VSSTRSPTVSIPTDTRMSPGWTARAESAADRWVAGHDIVDEGDEVRRSIGVALQEIGLDPVQTGRELLELQCGLYGITGSAGRERAAELLELVGLTGREKERVEGYSRLNRWKASARNRRLQPTSCVIISRACGAFSSLPSSGSL
jgi:ABC-type Na+ transport system ATPase subunit NatA